MDCDWNGFRSVKPHCVCVSVWSLQASCSYPYAPDRLRWARTESDLTGHSINLHRRPLCPQLWSPFPLYVSFSFSISPFLLDSLDFHMEASQISHPLRTKRNTSCHDHWPKLLSSPVMTSTWPCTTFLPCSLFPYSSSKVSDRMHNVIYAQSILCWSWTCLLYSYRTHILYPHLIRPYNTSIEFLIQFPSVVKRLIAI